MPNWCNNVLTITGPKNVLEEIAATGLCLDKIVPCPDDLRGMEKIHPVPKDQAWKVPTLMQKYGVATEFDWHVSRWGTKWDIGPMNIEVEEFNGTYEISVGFDSAWTPPVAAMTALFEKYKDQGLFLHLEYFEPGVSFLGVLIGKDGKISDDCREYEDADELAAYCKELDHSLAEGEIDWLREREAEAKAEEEEVEEKTTPKETPKAKKTAPKKAPKKAVSKKAVPKKAAPKKTAEPKASPKSTKELKKAATAKKAKPKATKMTKAERELAAFLAPERPQGLKKAAKKAGPKKAAKRG